MIVWSRARMNQRCGIIYRIVSISCLLFTTCLAYADQVDPGHVANVQPVTATLHMLSGLEKINTPFAVKLSPSHQYIAMFTDKYTVSVYPLTRELALQPPIFTSDQTFFVQEFAWAGDTLLVSGIPHADINLPIDDILRLHTAAIRVWTIGGHDLQPLLPYGASIMLPDHAGEQVALVNRTIDPPSAENTYITFFNVKQNKEMTTITLPNEGAFESMSFPIAWSKDNQALFFISTRFITDEGKPCPTLLSLTLDGQIRLLTKTAFDINQVKEPALLAYNRDDFRSLTTGNAADDLVGPIGGVQFPQLRIGYFNARGMTKAITVSSTTLPDIWKVRWQLNRGLWKFTITPDGAHMIFQDTGDKIAADDGRVLHPLYLWNLASGELKKIGQCPELGKTFGWIGNMLLFMTTEQNIKATGFTYWAVDYGIIALEEKLETK